MLKPVLLTAVAIGALIAGPVLADGHIVKLPAVAPAGQTAKARIDAAAANIDNGKAAEAAADMRDMIAAPDFATASTSIKASAYFMLALAEEDLKDYAAAYDHLMKVREVVSSPSRYYWIQLTQVALHLDKDADAVEALTGAINAEPARASELYMPFVGNVVRLSAQLKDGNVARQKLLEALWDAKYTPDNPFWSAQWFWSSLLEIYAAKGMDDKARQIAAVLTDPDLIIGLRVDTRYSRFVAGAPFGGDVAEALDGELAELTAKAAANPGLLAGAQSVGSALLKRNRLPEALAVLDAAIARAEKATNDKPAFTDQDDQLRWLYDTRSRVLAKMGRHEEVLAAQLKARDIALAAKDDTVSQTINLGDIYNSLGRPADALAAVKGIDDKGDGASIYGLMSAEEVRACAYAQTGDKAGLARSLAFMEAHADEGYGPYEAALLCADDGDGLAQLIISRLDDPELRNATLVDLQTYLALPHPTPVDAQLAARFETVKARADVQAAVAKYGVIESYPIFPPFN